MSATLAITEHSWEGPGRCGRGDRQRDRASFEHLL